MRRTLIALIALIAACDVSPTALENLDRSSVEWLVTRGAPAGPSQRVLLDLVDRLDVHHLTPGRLPGMDSLFALAVLDESRVAPNDADRTRAAHRAMIRRAWDAIDNGHRREGEEGLEQARGFQAETIVRVLGPGAPVVWLSIVSRTFERIQHTPPEGANGSLTDGPHAGYRAMSLTARDLLADAREALVRGNATGALDYATHAAGLINLLLAQSRPF
jgi:hypothetical protein